MWLAETSGFTGEINMEAFELVKAADGVLDLATLPEEVPAEPSGTRTATPLDAKHTAHIGWLASKGRGEYDAKLGCLKTHTLALAVMHGELKLKGEFKTLSSGTTERNCFAYPRPDGAWYVVRYGVGVNEHESWSETAAGLPSCDYNVKKTKVSGNQAEVLVGLGKEAGELFHDEHNQPYVTVKKGARKITMLVTDVLFRHTLRMAYSALKKEIAGPQHHPFEAVIRGVGR
jgi:hypothetical protein